MTATPEWAPKGPRSLAPADTARNLVLDAYEIMVHELAIALEHGQIDRAHRIAVALPWVSRILMPPKGSVDSGWRRKR